MISDETPLPWKKALLAVIPGFLATLGLIRSDFSIWMPVGAILLAGYLILAYLWNQKQFPAWSLMAAGMLTSLCLTVTSGVLGGIASLLAGQSANLLVLPLFLAVLIILLILFLQGRCISALDWTLFGIIIIFQLAVRIKYFFLFGLSWSIAGQWLSISLYAVVVALLFPLILGLRLARKYGPPALLFTVGMIFMSFQILIDVNHKVSDQIGGTAEFFVYQALIPLFFTVFAPLWFMRARSSQNRIIGMSVITGLAVILDLVVVGLSYQGTLPMMIWISFIPYTASVLLTLILAFRLYQNRSYSGVREKGPNLRCLWVLRTRKHLKFGKLPPLG